MHHASEREGVKVMKRLVSAVLALSLLGTTAAVATPYRDGSFSNRDNYRDHSDGNGAAIVAGVGLVALAAILASQHRHHHWHRGWYGNNGYDDSRSYNDGYVYNGNYGYDGNYGYHNYGSDDRDYR